MSFDEGFLMMCDRVLGRAAKKDPDNACFKYLPADDEEANTIPEAEAN